MEEIIIPKLSLSVKEAAEVLGVGTTALYTARTTGKLSGLQAPTFIKVGSRVRYRVDDIKKWLIMQPPFKTLAEVTDYKFQQERKA